MVLEQETITAELLLAKLAHRQLLSFAVRKTLSRETKWNLMLGTTRHDCCSFCPGFIRYVNMNQGLYLISLYLGQGTASLEDYYFMRTRAQGTSVFS